MMLSNVFSSSSSKMKGIAYTIIPLYSVKMGRKLLKLQFEVI